MEAAIGDGQRTVVANASEWQESYKPLPFLFFGLLMVWTVLVGIWTLNTWSKRQWQTSNLHWVLTSVPVLKALVLGLSLVFWYSCLNLSTCSFWVAFGVFVTRIFFETACFIAFLLISHGYCIMHEQLSVSERRSIAGLASILYLTLTGYKAAVPQFAVLVVVIYFILLYVIFLHVSKNLTVLRDQLQHIQDDGVQIMHSAVHTKYNMFKKFQGAMLMIVIAEVLMHTRAEGAANEYWIRLLIREWTEIGIFFYIGWTFRSREATPFFTVIPTLHSPDQRILPPIYSIEMNQNEFKNLDFKEWHIGVPTKGDSQKPTLVLVRNPGLSIHDDTALGTVSKTASDNVPRGVASNFSLPKCTQTTSTAPLSASDRTVSSSGCIFSKLLKQEITKHECGSASETCLECRYQSYLVGDREILFPMRNSRGCRRFSVVPSSADNSLASTSCSHLLLKRPLEFESLLSHFV